MSALTGPPDRDEHEDLKGRVLLLESVLSMLIDGLRDPKVSVIEAADMAEDMWHK